MVIFYHLRRSEAVINGSRYKDAGVDIDTGAALVKAIAPLTRATARPGADGDLGGFGGLFDLARAGFRDPVLVAATDGVGTKLIVANETGLHSTVGIDLVAMCVNDLVVQGAEPLFFLDYFATGRLDAKRATEVIAGIADGCREAGCALIGGETAEMPGMYGADDYDLAGFAVGAAERGNILDGATIEAGDVILGLESSGLHSNGFSLVRRIVAGDGLDYGAAAPFADGTLGEALLTPTRIYVQSCLAAHRAGHVKGFAHITGGGFPENVARILPDGMAAEIDAAAWAPGPVFGWLQEAGNIPPAEMAATFNCGIGMIAVTAPGDAGAATKILSDRGETVHRIGTVVPRKGKAPPVAVLGLDAAWGG